MHPGARKGAPSMIVAGGAEMPALLGARDRRATTLRWSATAAVTSWAHGPRPTALGGRFTIQWSRCRLRLRARRDLRADPGGRCRRLPHQALLAGQAGGARGAGAAAADRARAVRAGKPAGSPADRGRVRRQLPCSAAPAPARRVRAGSRRGAGSLDGSPAPPRPGTLRSPRSRAGPERRRRSPSATSRRRWCSPTRGISGMFRAARATRRTRRGSPTCWHTG